MKLAVVGGKGMLATDILGLCQARGIQAIGLDLPDFDITRDTPLADALPDADAVVNCAAYTRVDEAEADRDAAFLVNARGAGNLAGACAARAIPLLHISTDYVFDGTAARPYREDDPPHPVNVYGASKLAGEDAVRRSGARALIVRTQSLFGLHGASFARAILDRIAAGAPSLAVVEDQVSCPTFTGHLADAVLRLAATGRAGLVHAAASTSCSWYAFACAIVARVRPGLSVRPVSSARYPRAARRPAYSVLDTSRYASWTGAPLPPWEQGLEEFLSLCRSAGRV